MSTPVPAVNPAKMEQFLHKAISDFGSAISASMVVIGDRLGLYKAMAGSAPLTSEELAARTGTKERYVREWLVKAPTSSAADSRSSPP